jgi:hypothetical protein
MRLNYCRSKEECEFDELKIFNLFKPKLLRKLLKIKTRILQESFSISS